ncbi:protein trapped in endoderm-1 [Diprion similis]|uniref:protein trapped in endoderm-1 n=1 Tax=Diprion similis TaxID=362088 RepID=UPI001EF97B14|nr:protein trapped in endoderm-1 [Diprion similis]
MAGESLLVNSTGNYTDHPTFPRPVTIVAAVCAIVFGIVGVTGNLMTAIALLKYPRIRKHATTAFVISLSISDLIFSAINMPVTASRYIELNWILGGVMCRLFPIFFYGNVAVSLLSMVAITINRYLLISRPDIYPEIYTDRGITMMLIGIWVVSFSILIPSALDKWGTLGLDEKTFSCTILKKDGRSPKKLLFVIGFAIPCLVIIVSYLCIYWRVRQSLKKLQAHSGGKRGGFQRKEDSRVTRLMLTIFLCFLLCFMPLMVANVVDENMEMPVFNVIASILSWASSVINPFIYAGTNRLYREAYKQLLCPPRSSNRTFRPPRPTHSHSSKVSSPNVT